MLKSSTFFLLTITFVLVSLFTIFHGMFLTTSTLANNSESTSPLDNSTQWFQTKSKVIYLVMDGLRFDYFFKDNEIPEAELYKQERSHLFHEIFVNSPEKLVVCKAYADTPTLTVQRIPSVVTGGLPPKANVIMAFGALPIKEDSIIRQAHLAGRKPYFSGDSLWNDFFPDDLTTTTETRSFDIKDGDVDVATVDFIDYITKNKDFNIVIGHMLALDHMGHYRGLGDPKLAEAIQSMDKLVKHIMDIMDENTTLMIVGDHGMDYSGEHGHGTPGETNTAIVAYHKKGFQKYQQDLSQVMRSINETTKLVKQEDIVPTISMLLGLPIPFSNMGQILTDVYPVGSFPQLETCPESSFEVQAMRDNYINSIQIWNYFKENQHQSHLFKHPVFKYVKELLEEIESDYNDIQEMTKTSEKCSQIHERAIDTIKKSQFFATEVYRITRNTGSYDNTIVFTGVFSLILISICYVLITQYIYVQGPQEQIPAFNLKNFCLSLKSLIPLAILLPIISTCVWKYGKKRGIYAFVGAYLTVIFWFIGSLSIFLLTKRDKKEKASSPSTSNRKLQSSDLQEFNDQAISIQAAKVKSDDDMVVKKQDTSVDDPEDLPTTQNSKRANKHQDQTPLFGGENENTPFLPTSNLFIFQDIKYTICLVGIFIFSIYLIHVRNFLVLNLRYEKPASPYIALLLIGYRLGTILRGKMIFTMLLSILLCTYIHYTGIDLLEFNIMMPLGFFVGADYVFGEVSYLVKNFKTHRAWGLPYFISFALVALYHLSPSKENVLIELVVPKTIWAILLGTLVLRKVFKVEPEVWKRSAQLCIVIFLFLVRRDREILAFSLVLTLQKVTTHYFKKIEKRNFLFPIVMAFESYVGLFHLEFTDFNVPFNFKVAFIGLSRFSPIFSPLFFLCGYLSTIITGLIHVSHYNQYLDSQTGHGTQVRLTDSETYDEKPEFLSVGHARIMKKRNIVLFVPYFNLVMISAAIRLFVLREEHFDLVLEKFMIDALFYIFSCGAAFFML